MIAVTAPIILFLLIPLLPVILLPLLHRSPLARSAAPWVPATGLLLVPLAGMGVDYPWLLLGTRVGLDATALPVLVLATVAWTAAGWHARRTIPADGQARFFLFWLASWCGNLCVLITLDAASFYAAYAMMTLAAWGLVVHQRRPEDFRAGRVYLIMALLGEAMLIAGLLILAGTHGNFVLDAGAVARAGSVDEVAVWLLIAGFAVKMGLVPLHVWLPLAHPQAPVPASAVLSGVMLTAGLMGWIRFLPLGEAGWMAPANLLLAAGLLSVFFGVGAGLCQARPKVVLAYSSISQMGLIAVLVGLALRVPAESGPLVALAVLFALHHGLAKAALFLGVDLVRASPRLARWLLWLPAASLAGLPLTSGALVKTAWKQLLPETAGWLEPLLIASTIGTTVLLAHFLLRVWPRRSAGAGDARLLRPWLVLLLAGLILPWLLAMIRDPDWPLAAVQGGYIGAALWPVLAGAGIVLAVTLAGRRRNWRLPDVPGMHDPDSWLRAGRRARAPRVSAMASGSAVLAAYLPGSARAGTALARIDARLATLGVALLFWLLLLSGLFALAFLF